MLKPFIIFHPTVMCCFIEQLGRQQKKCWQYVWQWVQMGPATEEVMALLAPSLRGASFLLQDTSCRRTVGLNRTGLDSVNWFTNMANMAAVLRDVGPITGISTNQPDQPVQWDKYLLVIKLGWESQSLDCQRMSKSGI